MGLFTAFNSVASNVASTVTNSSEAGILLSRLIETFLVYFIVLKLTPILFYLIETIILAVWRRADTFVAAFLGTFAAVYVALMVYNN